MRFQYLLIFIFVIILGIACGGQKASESFNKEVPNSQEFQCQGKIYCSQMASCKEALFYLKNCPGTKIDGDGDKIPCEKEWCGHSVSQANHF